MLQGLTLEAGEYDSLRPLERADGLPALASEVVGLALHVTANGLRYCDPVTSRYLLAHDESEAARRAAEARVAELEARLRGDAER